MKDQKENSTPLLKTMRNKKKDFFKNHLDYLTIISPKEKEKLINQQKYEKNKNNNQKRKNKAENNEKNEKRNLSPLLVKFRNFYSLLQKMKQKQKSSRIKNEKKNVDDCIKIHNIQKDEKNNEKNFQFMSINKVNFPLDFRDINCIKNSKNQQQESQNEKLIYLQTTNGIKYINNSCFNSSRKQLLNNNDQTKYLCRNIIKKFPAFLYENNNINHNRENKELNLPSITCKRRNININLNDYQSMNKNNSLKVLNKNQTFLNYSYNNLESNPINNKNCYYTKHIEKNEKNNENAKNYFAVNNNSANNCNKKNIFKQDLKSKTKSKIYSIKKNFEFCFLFDTPPLNFYKDEYYYYNIYPENCGWMIKNCFKHRLKWRECHCNNTNLFNFKWKEAANKNEFFDLGLTKIQMINHFEYQSCITNKWKLFYNFTKYCEEKNIDVFKYLPFTIILDVTNFQQFLNIKENFKKLFNNINDYLFDSNSINNKIFDRRKMQYKLLFPNQDQKFGIKIYCEIPKSHFIGKNLWIVKAPNLNRGRCVKVFNSFNGIFNYIKKISEGKANEYDIKDIKKEEENNIINSQNPKEEHNSGEIVSKDDNQEEKEYKYQSSIIIIQKYIERPFLYKGRKFDIRIWALLTHKMEAYIFKEGHLKASSVDFDTNNFDSFVHLTNYSLQKYNKYFSKFEKGNEISFKVFQEFIDSQENNFNFKEEIFPKFMEIIKHTMLCSKNKINLNNRIHCFEIFGYDFMMDEDKNIYLIEINTNPGLEISSDLIGELVPRMIDDALLLTVDDLFPTEYDNKSKTENGKYKSKYHVNGYSDEENMWEFVCDMKKNVEKELFNSFCFNNKNFKKIKKKIKKKKMKNKK